MGHHQKFEDVIASPFARNRALLADVKAGQEPIDMTIGEPRHGMPSFVSDVLAEHVAGFEKYPPIPGTPGLRLSIGGWMKRRYPGLAGIADLDSLILPLNGTREGLFSAAFSAVNRRSFDEKPVFLMPNPFYQVYVAGSMAAGGRAVFLPAVEEKGFLPDLDALDENILKQTAAFYLCSPSNPEGAVADKAYLEKAIRLARKYDFMLFSDECYSEIYFDAAPAGALEVAYGIDATFKNVVAFNSLSKRSNLPGLRSGFVAGDENFMRSYSQFRNVACPQVPLPVQHVSEKVWNEEKHVETNRQLYREKFLLTKDLLGSVVPINIPSGGFFIWLNMKEFGGSEVMTETLWKESGVKVLPGAYLAHQDGTGFNPGVDYIRIALVQDIDITREALKRICSVLCK